MACSSYPARTSDKYPKSTSHPTSSIKAHRSIKQRLVLKMCPSFPFSTTKANESLPNWDRKNKKKRKGNPPPLPNATNLQKSNKTTTHAAAPNASHHFISFPPGTIAHVISSLPPAGRIPNQEHCKSGEERR